MTFVVAGGPIRNRAWCVAPHVASLARNGVGAFCYVVGDSDDSTHAALLDAIRVTNLTYSVVSRRDHAGAGWDRVAPRYSMANLAEARNAWWQEACRAFPQATHLWACDSDVVVDGGGLEKLANARNLMVGAVVRNSATAPVWNFMCGWDGGEPARDGDEGDVVAASSLEIASEVSFVGACVLYERRVFEEMGLAYVSDERMEERAICQGLDDLALAPSVVPGALTSHVQRDGSVWRP